MKLSINPSLVMMRECPCSTKTREVLGNPSPPPSRFSSAVGFAPLDPRDFPRASPSGNPSGLGVQNPWPREISQDFPRPSRFPSGFALRKSLRSREILGVGDGFSNPSLLLVEHGYSHYFRTKASARLMNIKGVPIHRCYGSVMPMENGPFVFCSDQVYNH